MLSLGGSTRASWNTQILISSLLKKDLERAAVSTVRHCCSRKANKKRGSSSLRCSEWRAKTVFQQAANQDLTNNPACWRSIRRELSPYYRALADGVELFDYIDGIS